MWGGAFKGYALCDRTDHTSERIRTAAHTAWDYARWPQLVSAAKRSKVRVIETDNRPDHGYHPNWARPRHGVWDYADGTRRCCGSQWEGPYRHY